MKFKFAKKESKLLRHIAYYDRNDMMTIKNGKIIDVIMEVDSLTYKHYVIERNHILSLWVSSYVYDGTHILRCLNCLGFGHKRNVCKRNLACIKCGKEHRYNVCEEKNVSCVNCNRENIKIGIRKFDGNHYALSKDCPAYNDFLEKVKCTINYGN